MVRNSPWTKEETIIAFNIYCKLPFSKITKSHPTVIKYAAILGRTPSALSMKLGNIARLDPELKKRGVGGLRHGAKMEQEVWDEFYGNWDELAYKSEWLITQFQNKDINDSEVLEFDSPPAGKERETTIRARVNQGFFRAAVLSAYNSTCCITGLNIPALLNASHIKPWKDDAQNRTNPHNGLCLNTLHDRAFDYGFITISKDYRVMLSKDFGKYTENEAVQDFFKRYENESITKSHKFKPSEEFLKYHRDMVFEKVGF